MRMMKYIADLHPNKTPSSHDWMDPNWIWKEWYTNTMARLASENAKIYEIVRTTEKDWTALDWTENYHRVLTFPSIEDLHFFVPIVIALKIK